MSTARRHIFSLRRFEAIAGRAQVGYLGITTPDGYPRVVPVNFATVGDRVYFHGARTGEKYESLATGQNVTFCIAVPYSMIPSYWRSTDYACPATQYFESVLIRGRGVVVSDPAEKAKALQALMDNHQPEGGFKRIDPDDRLYTKAVAEVAIFRIDPDRIDFRTKFGDHLSAEIRRLIITKLKERNIGVDKITAREMERRLETSQSEEDNQ
jgi:nitroimidazol reductase NimA-like FMN-containing flavoprotein (pyridoxamine 5'-phosphate oxidase superfamily)